VLASKLVEFRSALRGLRPRAALRLWQRGPYAHRHHDSGGAQGPQARLVDPKGDDYARYKGATVLTPNLAELREVVGSWRNEKDLASRAHALREKLKLDALLLTRGEEGMTLFRNRKTFHVKAEKREVSDVTGAGDTVIATLAGDAGRGRRPRIGHAHRQFAPAASRSPSSAPPR